MDQYEWLEKRTLRSVDQLRLWPDNPRLDPEKSHISISDYATDLISENGEKDAFFKLIDSISSSGFIPSDPIVVWKNEDNDKYYVAEGNRRILALKLLRNPEKSPRSIKNYIKKKSELIDRNSIEKIRVCVAPSIEATEWYINQRHSSSSIQRSWSRHQQQRWIAELYDKYNKDVDKVSSITGLNKGELEFTLRILQLRDLALKPFLLNLLNFEEKEKVKSHRIPMTILERWFTNPIVREKWGIEFEEDKVIITSNEKSFLTAYASWLKFVIKRDELDVKLQINTRTITSDFDNIIKTLPEVSFGVDEQEETSDTTNSSNESGYKKNENESDSSNKIGNQEDSQNAKRPLSKNPDRNQIVVKTCKLSTSNYKLDALFREFKKIPVNNYKNCVAASLRVFLDLAINEFISSENCKEDICSQFKDKSFKDINLKQRLEYLKKNKLTSKTLSYKVVDKLLSPGDHYSLDTLNSYVHGIDTHNTSRRFLNGFWDFLFPLFEKIIDIKEG